MRDDEDERALKILWDVLADFDATDDEDSAWEALTRRSMLDCE